MPAFHPSPIARRVASQISPGLQRFAADGEDAVVAAIAGDGLRGMPARIGLHAIYPGLVGFVPAGTEIITDEVLGHFGTLSVSDLLKLLADHAASRGGSVHESHGRVLLLAPAADRAHRQPDHVIQVTTNI